MADTTDSAEHEYKIFVNTREKTVTSDEASFHEIAELAYPGPHKPDVHFTITYRDAAGDKEGTLTKGQTVKIKNGTIFNVTKTDKS
jgi:Multiubiquitin